MPNRTDPSWRVRFLDAIGNPAVLSLATVDRHGNPEVRCVICRRVGQDGGLWITSDTRGAKNMELSEVPRAAAVCWLAASREQFRFSGTVEILPADRAEAREIWSELPAETRAMFSHPPPGEPRSPDAAFAVPADLSAPPATFSLLVLHPTVVEHLQLSFHPHRRRRWSPAEPDGIELNP